MSVLLATEQEDVFRCMPGVLGVGSVVMPEDSLEMKSQWIAFFWQCQIDGGKSQHEII